MQKMFNRGIRYIIINVLPNFALQEINQSDHIRLLTTGLPLIKRTGMYGSVKQSLEKCAFLIIWRNYVICLRFCEKT